MNTDNPQLLFGPAEIARMLRISRNAFYKMLNAGTLPAPDVRLGPRTPRWRRETVEQLIGGPLPDGSPVDTPPVRRVTMAEIRAMTGFSDVQIATAVRLGEFPEPDETAPRRLWDFDAVVKWLETGKTRLDATA